jgi:hypothetical protein
MRRAKAPDRPSSLRRSIDDSASMKSDGPLVCFWSNRLICSSLSESESKIAGPSSRPLGEVARPRALQVCRDFLNRRHPLTFGGIVRMCVNLQSPPWRSFLPSFSRAVARSTVAIVLSIKRSLESRLPRLTFIRPQTSLLLGISIDSLSEETRLRPWPRPLPQVVG